MSAMQQPGWVSLTVFWEQVAMQSQHRLEYRHGIIIENMAGGSRNHALICANCVTMLRTALRGQCRVFTSDAYVQVATEQLYLPDVTVSCAAQPADATNVVAEPTLVVEVLSPSTSSFDRLIKLADYRECPTILTILMIWQDQRRVEVYEREGDNLWSIRTLKSADHYQLHHLPVALNLDVVYEDAEALPV